VADMPRIINAPDMRIGDLINTDSRADPDSKYLLAIVIPPPAGRTGFALYFLIGENRFLMHWDSLPYNRMVWLIQRA